MANIEVDWDDNKTELCFCIVQTYNEWFGKNFNDFEKCCNLYALSRP